MRGPQTSRPGSVYTLFIYPETWEVTLLDVAVKFKCSSLSRVRLSATPWTAAYQGPPSMGFSRQEYWSGVPLPSPYLANVFLFFPVVVLHGQPLKVKSEVVG